MDPHTNAPYPACVLTDSFQQVAEEELVREHFA